MTNNFYYLIIGVWLVVLLWKLLRRIRIGNVKPAQLEALKFLQSILLMRIEKIDNTLYAYNVMNGEFVCQGNNFEDLNSIFLQRYPNRKGIVVDPINEGILR